MPDLSTEFEYRTSRSGGKGGQHVNKVETRVEARWKIAETALLSAEEQALVWEHLQQRITADGYLSVTCSEARTQLENRHLAAKRLQHLVAKALTPVPKRIPTRVPRAAKEKRKQDKQRLSERKRMRRSSGEGL